MELSSWAVPLISGAIGAGGVLASQLISSARQRKTEIDKRRWALEDEKRKRAETLSEKKFSVYNEVLKFAREYVTVDNTSQDFLQGIDRYREKFRHIFYDNLHLLDKDVYVLVGQFDEIIFNIHLQIEVFNQDTPHDLVQVATMIYVDMIHAIEEKYNVYEENIPE